MAVTLRFIPVVLLAALSLLGCGRGRSRVEAWVWPGANRCNTLFFARSGTGLGPALQYSEVWEAEWFDVPAQEPVPGAAHTGHRPLVLDLDRDGRLEIVTSPLTQAPLTILNPEGARLSGRARNRMDWSRIQNDSVRIVADGGAGRVMRAEPAVLSGTMAVEVNERLVTLCVVPGYPRRVIECRDADGRLLWQHGSEAQADLMGVADLNQDGSEELLFTTYADEYGARGSDSCYCFALRDDGTLLWQHGFGTHPYIGCTAGVADLDGDRRQDVFVAVYSWQNDFGGLTILDGATGEVRALPPETFPASHGSAACADVDGDGRLELAAAVSGQAAEVLLYRLEPAGLRVSARTRLGEARDSGEVSECRLHAICDLDGDGQGELVLSRCRQRAMSDDPMFHPSSFDSCGLLVLASDLGLRQEIPLPIRCQDVTLGDVVPGGDVELLVVTDRLRLYSSAAE